MAAPGEVVPLEFAQGILALRSTLAQEKARLEEMKRMHQVQEQLEQMRLAIQAQGQAQSGALESRGLDIRENLGKMQVSSEEKKTDAMLQFRMEELKQEREASTNNIMGKIGQQPVYVPPWMKLPANIQGPMVKDAEGKETPAYKVAVEPDGQGGHFVVPLQNLEDQAKYDKLVQDRSRIMAQSMLMRTRAETERLRQDDFDLRIQEKLKGMTVEQAHKSVGAFQRWKEINDKRLIFQQAMAEPELAEQIKADPFYGLSDRERTLAEDIISNAEAGARRIGQGPGDLKRRSVFGFAPEDIANRVNAAVPPIPGAKDEAAVNQNNLGLFNTAEEAGFIDASKGMDKATFIPGKPARATKSMAPGRRRIYFDQAGNQSGYELYSEDGTFIRAEGQTPKSPAGKKGDLQPIQLPAPAVPPPAAGVPQAATPQDRLQRMLALTEKLEAGTATDEEKKELQALLGQ